jgi:hypothetical protein
MRKQNGFTNFLGAWCLKFKRFLSIFTGGDTPSEVLPYKIQHSYNRNTQSDSPLPVFCEMVEAEAVFTGGDTPSEVLPYKIQHSYNRNTQSDSPLPVFCEMVEAEAVILFQSSGTISGLEDCDSDMGMLYLYYEYEYRVPGTDEIRKHRDKIEFSVSIFGLWHYEKYDKGFKFRVKYNKDHPTRHLRLHNFD